MSNPQMTWKEFKNEVDRILKERDISEDTAVWYIDISWPDAGDFKTERIIVGYDPKKGICV